MLPCLASTGWPPAWERSARTSFPFCCVQRWPVGASRYFSMAELSPAPAGEAGMPTPCGGTWPNCGCPYGCCPTCGWGYGCWPGGPEGPGGLGTPGGGWGGGTWPKG